MYFTTLNVPKTCKGIINLTSKSPNELEKKKKVISICTFHETTQKTVFKFAISQ